MVKVGAIIQVRLGSERLPNKAFMPLPFAGGPLLLEHIIARSQSSDKISEVIVATTNATNDDAIHHFCELNNILCFRGSEDDVLERFYATATKYKLDVIVRLTGDNPFIMPAVINDTVNRHITAEADYTLTEGLPLGTNIEVISFKALEIAAINAKEQSDREHVTPFIRREKNFKIQQIHHTSTVGNLRLTIDYPSDYALASLLYSRLYQANPLFDNKELELLLLQNPWMVNVNEQKQQRQAFCSEAEELIEAIKILQEGGFNRVIQKLREKIK